MKKITTFFLFVILFCNAESQTIINYQTWSGGTACNLFASSIDVPCTIDGNNSTKSHKTNVGQPRYSSTDKAVLLDCESVSGIKGTQYEIFNTFKQGYTYKITVNAARIQSSPYSNASLILDINNGGNGGNTVCNGTGTVSVGGGSSQSNSISNNTFSDYNYNFLSPLSQNLSSLIIYDNSPAGSPNQTVFIRKITITETAPSPPASCNLLAPTSLGVSNNGTILTWIAPTNATARITYNVKIDDGGIITNQAGINTTSLNYCPLAAGNNISFTVQAVCRNDVAGALSSPFSFVAPGSIPAPTNLSAVQGTGSFNYGYHIHYTPPIVNGSNFTAGCYMEWFDLTTNTSGGTTSIGYSTANDWQNFFYYPPAGHSFKFRLASASPCGPGYWSAWSAPQPSNCSLTLDASTFSAYTTNPGSYHNGYETCVFGAVANAISYEIESQAFNISTGQYQYVMTTNSTTNNVNVYTGSSLPTNAGWAFHFRVRAKCSNNLWGNYSSWSNNYAL
jgi:hypothetical protein